MTKKRNIVLILVVSTLVMLSFWGSLGYILFYSVNNEIKLEQEFSEIDNMIDENGLDDPDLDTKLNTYVSRHDYLVVEQAVKAYLRDLLKESRNLYNLYNDEKLTDLITIENFKTDGKEFINSQAYLEESQVQLQNIQNNINAIHTEENLQKYLKKDLNDYYIDYYHEFILNSDDNDLDEINDSILSFANLIAEYQQFFKFLSDYQDYWYIENDQLYFESDNLLDEYNHFFDDFNDIQDDNLTTI